MGYESRMNLAIKPEAAESFLARMGDPKDVNSPLYGAEIERDENSVSVSWPYDKYGCQDDIEEALKEVPETDYCYLEENEYGDFVNMGSWWDNPWVTPIQAVRFGGDESPFAQVFGMMKEHLGEDEARKALEEFHERLGGAESPRP